MKTEAIKDIKELLKTHFDSIKRLGYYSVNIDNFYQEIIKDLNEADFKNNINQFYLKLEDKLLDFLKKEIHPGTFYSINVIFKIFPISNKVINEIIKLVLDTFEKKLKTTVENNYAVSPSNLNLIFSCISILATIADYNKLFKHYRLNMENYQQFLEINSFVDEKFIDEKQNGILSIRNQVLKIKKDLIKP